MSEVRYSVNGKYFKDFGMYISDSDGLFDGLKRKKINTYDWAEYNGSAPDLSNPKFEAREITLKGFVVGDDWLLMKSNFDTILSEFQKSGTQRLLIEPLGLKPLPFEVYLEDSTPLNKTFKDRKMVGTFTLKLTEPNPIKKVFTTDLDVINLSYLINSETEIFWGDGTKNIFSGNVTESKDFHFPSYQNSGYSIVLQNPVNLNYFQIDSFVSAKNNYEFSVSVNDLGNSILYVIGRNKMSNNYELITKSEEYTGIKQMLKVISNVDLSKYGKIFFKVLSGGSEIPGLVMTNPRIERVDIIGEWQNMIGKTKYIIVAGNINELTNVTTNTEELWTKL